MTGSIEKLSEEYDIDISWRPFPLHPETPEDGKTLQQLFAGSTVDVPAMLQHLRQVADSLGLEFGERTHTYNSRLAQELGLWAEDKGKGHEFHMAAFIAYFAHGHNLAKTEVLLKIIEELGLDAQEAARIIEQREYSSQVDEHWQEAYRSGITAVPTFVAGGKKLTGAQPYNDLLRFLHEVIPGLKER